ncbi:tetratricopeptide repeat protein, partial [Saccharopolyspora sp. K220]|uniref:tetratricopeptide repeat protein n=1 Tax=Saccharopolyspora soli TaxID=2926618 RepID=UPI001F59468B
MAGSRWSRLPLTAGVLAGVGIAAVVVFRSGVLGRLAIEPSDLWVWLERASWFAASAGLIVAILPMVRRSGTGSAPRLVANPIRPGQEVHPDTSSLDVPDHGDERIRGRDELVEELSRWLVGRRVRAKAAVLHGLGGAGKSSLARVLARGALRKGFAVWWVVAATGTDLQVGMRNLALRLGATEFEVDRAWSGMSSATDLVWGLLNRQPGRWLLVIDNADSPEVLAGAGREVATGVGWLRPPARSRGCVLVTSRNGDRRVWGPWCSLFQVPVLAPEDGAGVLLDRAGEHAGTRDDAEALARRLGGLPLALHLAGAHLADDADLPLAGVSTFRDYQEEFETASAVSAADTAASLGDLQDGIGRMCDVSFQRLERRGIPEARPLWMLLSCFAEAPVPYRFLLDVDVLTTAEPFSGLDGNRLRRVLRALADLGIVQVVVRPRGTDEEPTLRIHPLVRFAGRRTADTAFLELAGRLLHRAALAEEPESAENPRRWHMWGAVAPHADHLLDAVAHLDPPPPDLLVNVAYVARLLGAHLRARGFFTETRRWHAAVVQTCAPVVGLDHPVVLSARHSLAALLHASGQFVEAEAQYRSTLDDRRRVLGESDPAALSTLHQLSSLHFDLHRFDEADRGFRTVLDHIGDLPLNDRPTLALSSRIMIARVSLQRGETDAAESEFERLLIEHTDLLGAEHPRTMWVRAELAHLHHLRGDLDRAGSEYASILA